MALIITIKVIPSSGKSGFLKDKNGVIKCFLKSAPERGLANKELIKTLSQALLIPQNVIEIISGLTNRAKKIKIHTSLTEKDLCTLLGLSFQKSL